MALIIILIAFYFDFKSEKLTFINDLKGGVFIILLLIISAILQLYVFNIHFLYMIFSTGIEILLIFSIKAFLNNQSNS